VTTRRLSLAKWPPSVWIGMAIVLGFAFLAAFGPMLAPHGEGQVIGDVWEPLSWVHPLGTDNLGRDMLSRMLFGARTTVGIALSATVLAFLLGSILGFLAASIGGVMDQLISRAVDTVMAIPTLIFALVVLSVIPTSIPVLIAVMAVLNATPVFRVSRAVAMDIAVMDYVEVARLRGEGVLWLMGREILPNALTPLIAEFGLRFSFAMLFLAALSFLGMGVQPPAADWGGMVKENSAAVSFGLVAPLIPAAAIAIMTIGVNLVVDWVLNRTSLLRREG